MPPGDVSGVSPGAQGATAGNHHEGLEGARPSSRRDFLAGAGTWALGLTAVGYGVSIVEYLFPRVLYEPPTEFSVGRAGDFPPGTATFLEQKRLFVFRAPEGLYAVSAVCTHLGCNVRWVDTSERFECPCHGSIYDRAGRVISGPAPRPLLWYKLSMARSGAVVVDTAQAVTPDFRLHV